MDVLQPKLRFPEFEGEWQTEILGNISSKSKYGLNSSAKEYDGINGYIRITDIDELSRKFLKDKITSPDEFDDSYLLELNDLLFTRTGASTGKTYLYDSNDGKLFFAGFLIKFNITEANSKFVFYQTLLSKYDKWVKIMSMRSGQPGINAEEYSSLPLVLPKIEEQTKIANFLSSIDEKINLLKEKKALLEEYKKGIMQKIFNQEIRFKDDNGNDFGEWGNVNLEYVASNYYQGINTAADKTEYYSEGYPILQAKHITSEKISYEDSKFMNQKDYDLYKNKYKPNVDDILISNIGTIGRVILIREDVDFLIAWNIFKVTLKSKLSNPLFIAFNLKYISALGYFDECKTGNATKFVNKSDMLNAPISLPSLKEQTKIANFLSAIDEKIALVAIQIEDTQEYKKGLLQQMFV